MTLDDPIPLTPALLDELESRWRNANAAILGDLAPGLSDEQIDDLTLSVGLRLPEEARMWWRWHRGVDAGQAGFFGSTRRLMRLDLAVEDWLAQGGFQHPELAAKLPIASGAPGLYIDPLGTPSGLAPVFANDPPDAWERIPNLPSLGALVTAWIDLIDCGMWAIGADGLPVDDYLLLPDHVAATGIEYDVRGLI